MGPEEDLLIQARKGLDQIKTPTGIKVKRLVYYDGEQHDATYPQIIVDFSNIQDQPRGFKAIEQTKQTISVDVYTKPDRLDVLFDLSNQVRNIMRKVRCDSWWSDFDQYSCRILDDESYQGQSLKRAAFLFDYITRGIAIKKG